MQADSAVRQTAAVSKNPPTSFAATVREFTGIPLRRAPLAVLQVNMGRLCNQACEHCHVDAGPKRREIMSPATMEEIVDWCRRNRVPEVDITGGAPEMNPGFRTFVDALLAIGARVQVRCNLTILLEPGQQDLVDWYAERGIDLVCSLPCYSRENVDGQRGKGVFEKSVTAIRLLNEAGYAGPGGPCLDLVYNPGGAFLPPAQEQLESDYRQRLGDDFGLVFNRLLALANLPINRFARFLANHGQLDDYRRLLRDSFNPATVAGLMCRHLVSIDWQGYVYDCDFNQMLDMPAAATGPDRIHLRELSSDALEGAPIATAEHCFGCTAGAGSSCGGSLA